MPGIQYDKSSRGAKAYVQFAKEILKLVRLKNNKNIILKLNYQ